MATNKQRDAERRRLQQQLAERRAKEIARRRFTLISSVVGSLVVIALIVVVIVAATSGNDDKTQSGTKDSGSPTTTAPTSTSPTASQCGQAQFPTIKVRAATGASVSFKGVTVKGAADLGGKPGVTSKSTAKPTKIEVKDLVVGRGRPAKATSCVDVQYLGALYTTGKEFDSSWGRGQIAQFSLAGVVPGFTQGIAGTTGIAPMNVGGRRLIIIPSALAYGTAGSGSTIPPNSVLVFVVDLVKVS